ncbi:MAG: hypothetical protein FWG08_07310 [Propionibacteriaceae bacterium]|nr:hypothetical protein [Propionibacteriaceae bacterium]
MDKESSKLAKKQAATTMRELAKQHGYKTRDGEQWQIRGEFFLNFSTLYSDSASKEPRKRDCGLDLIQVIKTDESDHLLWEIFGISDKLKQYSTDRLRGWDAVQGPLLHDQWFPIEDIDQVETVCLDILHTVEGKFQEFLTGIEYSVQAYYEYVLSDRPPISQDQYLVPICYIQLGRIQELLDFLDTHEGQRMMGEGPVDIPQSMAGQRVGDRFREYCYELLNAQ